MTEKELTVLRHLSPQDYLQFMQGVWAQLTMLRPDKLRDQALFSRFSDLLSELERLVVKELKLEGDIRPDTLRKLNLLRGIMDDTFREMQKELKLTDYMAFPKLVNTH